MERLSATVIFVALLSIFLTVLVLVTALPDNKSGSSAENSANISVEPGISHYDTASAIVKEGKELFEDNCKSCHAVHKIVVGPPLKGIAQKREKAWLYKWIRNSSALRASGDKQAIEIYNQYNKTEMTSFMSFTDKQIDAILEYISYDGNIIPNDTRPVVFD